ncbi:MAG: ABC transporter substrate-binding protein [Candidatus Diapherotrites archaeon]|nr:ABC transporter substrate-binding protein [Candidatus Diapherotrites archaeon]
MNNNPFLYAMALGLLLSAGCVSAPLQPEEKETIKVAYLPSYQSLPLFVAVEQGMFEEAGLKVDVLRIETPKDIIDGLITGKIDGGPHSVAAGIATIVESQNPGALKVYALTCVYATHRATEILVPVDSTLSSIAELRGKKIGHIPGPQWATMTKKTLLVNGIRLEDVTLIELPFSSQLPTLASHGVDAIFTLEPTGFIGEQKNSAKVLLQAPFEKNVVNPWCGGAGVVSTKFIQRNPSMAKKFVEIMNRAGKEVETNPETRKYLVQYLQLPEDAAKQVDIGKLIPVSEATPEIIDAYQQFADVFLELEVTSKKVNVKDLFWSGS